MHVIVRTKSVRHIILWSFVGASLALSAVTTNFQVEPFSFAHPAEFNLYVPQLAMHFSSGFKDRIRLCFIDELEISRA